MDLGRAPAEAPSPANDAEEARASAAAVDEDDDAPGFGPEVPKPAPLRRVNMLDEGGKAHPMVQAARNQQREPAVGGEQAADVVGWWWCGQRRRLTLIPRVCTECRALRAADRQPHRRHGLAHADAARQDGGRQRVPRRASKGPLAREADDLCLVSYRLTLFSRSDS